MTQILVVLTKTFQFLFVFSLSIYKIILYKLLNTQRSGEDKYGFRMKASVEYLPSFMLTALMVIFVIGYSFLYRSLQASFIHPESTFTIRFQQNSAYNMYNLHMIIIE
jgi:hypothetical protein